MEVRCGGLLFFSNFDSGNLAKVEQVKPNASPNDSNSNSRTDKASNNLGAECAKIADMQFNVWTSPDCKGTVFENGNRTWFYFGLRGGSRGQTIRINVMNMNRQGKLYTQGMAPMVRTVPGKSTKWQRIRDRPTHTVLDGQFILSFTHTFSESRNATTYFAFCYPFSYNDCEKKLEELDKQFDTCDKDQENNDMKDHDIYYRRELLVHSLEGRRVDWITVSSCKGLQDEREETIPGLFPNKDSKRPHKFNGKKVFVVTSRVHPGETPGSFVFNGFLDFILRRNDPRAVALRDLFVFKLIPLLNPDGVFHGFYRTDTRGVNLNRVYTDPDPKLHPSIFAVKTLIMYHHTFREQKRLKCTCYDFSGSEADVKDNDSILGCSGGTEQFRDSISTLEEPPFDALVDSTDIVSSGHIHESLFSTTSNENRKDALDSHYSGSERTVRDSSFTTDLSGYLDNTMSTVTNLQSEPVDSEKDVTLVESEKKSLPIGMDHHGLNMCDSASDCDVKEEVVTQEKLCVCNSHSFQKKDGESGLACYIDLHGHASKRGCFLYANRLQTFEDQVRCLLLPKLMALNCANFDFNACNFSERNMYNKDKRDGTSKEGSGRVAIYKATGLIHSYTLECNYNTGKMVNAVPPASYDCGRATPPPPPGVPPRFTPAIYEEVGRAIAISILDIVERNPWSRLLLSEHRGLQGLLSWTSKYLRSLHNAPALPKKYFREISKTSSLIASSLNTLSNAGNEKYPKGQGRNNKTTSSESKPVVADKQICNGTRGDKVLHPLKKPSGLIKDDRKQGVERRAKKSEHLPNALSQDPSFLSKATLSLPTSHSFLDGIQEEKSIILATTLPRKVTLLKGRESKLKTMDAAKKSTTRQLPGSGLPNKPRSLSWELSREGLIHNAVTIQAETSKKVLSCRKTGGSSFHESSSFASKDRFNRGLTSMAPERKGRLSSQTIVFPSGGD